MSSPQSAHPRVASVTASLWQAHAARLAEALRSRGVIQAPEIERAFVVTPRHMFVPAFYDREVIAPQPTNDQALEAWLSRVYADTPLVVALDGRGKARSSSTAPWLMAMMITALEVREGSTVLEIGTGTGYNAALLSRLVGDRGRVHTLEIDGALAAQAADRLASLGCANVTVHQGDATGTLPVSDRFDRVVVTAGFRKVVTAWWEQLIGGGILVGNLRGTLAGGVAVIRKGDEGQGRGHLLDTANVGFTPLFGHELEAAEASTASDPTDWQARTNFDPSYLAPDQGGFRFVLQLEMPGAAVTTRSSAEATVVELNQHGQLLRFSDGLVVGDQLLYASLLRAFELWNELGRPQLRDFGIEIERAERQFIVVLRRDASPQRWQLN